MTQNQYRRYWPVLLGAGLILKYAGSLYTTTTDKTVWLRNKADI